MPGKKTKKQNGRGKMSDEFPTKVKRKTTKKTRDA